MLRQTNRISMDSLLITPLFFTSEKVAAAVSSSQGGVKIPDHRRLVCLPGVLYLLLVLRGSEAHEAREA